MVLRMVEAWGRTLEAGGEWYRLWENLRGRDNGRVLGIMVEAGGEFVRLYEGE